ncbi:MAG: biotin--[acetyl-CoA-carboxylase] ligase [Acidimicrobiales bacterium]
MKVTSQRFSEIRWIEETGSTNRDLLDAATEGRPAGSVLVTDHQTAGRGRQGRTWLDDPGRSLLFSVLLRPEADRTSVLPLVMGMAVVDAIRKVSSVPAVLKWPNDVLVVDADGSERKLAGILAEAVTTADGLAVVVGCGINVAFVTGPPNEVRDRAIDLVSAASAPVDRAVLLEAILGALDHWLDLLDRAGAEAIIEEYRDRCVTLGRVVTLETPAGVVTGTAVDIDPSGGLVLEVEGERRTLFAGDAHHQR